MKTPNHTLNDIEQLVVIVQLNGNCHQVLLSKEDKELVKHFIANMTGGLKLTEELMPVKFEPLSKPGTLPHNAKPFPELSFKDGEWGR